MTKTQFRIATAGSFGVGVVGVIASIAGRSSLPAPLREYLDQRQSQQFADLTAIEGAALLIMVPLAVAGIVSLIGLLRFRPWSRPLAVVSSALGFLSMPPFGPTVETGLAEAFFYLSTLSLGAVIAIAYCSPTAAKWFEVSPPDTPLPQASNEIELPGLRESLTTLAAPLRALRLRKVGEQGISRLIALALLSILGGWAAFESDRSALVRYREYTHDQLLASLESEQMGSRLACGIAIFCVGLLFLAILEGIAFAVRRIIARVAGRRASP